MLARPQAAAAAAVVGTSSARTRGASAHHISCYYYHPMLPTIFNVEDMPLHSLPATLQPKLARQYQLVLLTGAGHTCHLIEAGPQPLLVCASQLLS